MLQIRIYGDFEDPANPEFLKELGDLRKFHVGSVDLRDHLDGPNLLRPNPAHALQILNTFQKSQKIPLLIGSDIERVFCG
jgi:hypothetical protein